MEFWILSHGDTNECECPKRDSSPFFSGKFFRTRKDGCSDQSYQHSEKGREDVDRTITPKMPMDPFSHVMAQEKSDNCSQDMHKESIETSSTNKMKYKPDDQRNKNS